MATEHDPYEKMASALTLFGRVLEGVVFTRVVFTTTPDVQVDNQLIWTVAVKLLCFGGIDEETDEPILLRDTTWEVEADGHGRAVEGLSSVIQEMLTAEIAQRENQQAVTKQAIATLRDGGPAAPAFWSEPSTDPPVQEEEEIQVLDLSPKARSPLSQAQARSTAAEPEPPQGIWEDDAGRDDGVDAEDRAAAPRVLLASDIASPTSGPPSAKLTSEQKMRALYGKNMQFDAEGKPFFPQKVPAVYDPEGNRVSSKDFLQGLLADAGSLAALGPDARAFLAHLQKPKTPLPADERAMVAQLQSRLDAEMKIDF